MSIFSKVAMPKPAQNTFDLSHDRKFSMKIGEITPILCQETVPGDKFNVESTNLLRFAPMLAPIMHQTSVYVHYFFVPNRILWSNWEDFITGGEDGLSNPAFPVFDNLGTIAEGTLMDYLGVPTGTSITDSVNALPACAYNKIYNEYYRDQNVATKLTDTVSNGSNSGTPFIQLQKRAWQHDYFTSALPWTQRGPEATIPLGSTAPISYVNGPEATIFRNNADGTVIANAAFDGAAALETTAGGALKAALPSTTYIDVDNTDSLSVDLSTATAASINELRRAFRLQEWLERNARGGARYIEVIMAHFGVKSSDSRLQRPEFLGGSATPVTISEVLQTSDNASETTPQANMAGHGVAVGQSNKVSYFCEEHGFIMGLMTVMPKSAYQQGLPKIFSKFDKFDYFWPSFQSIGEQPIYNQEIYYNEADSQNSGVFGYTPRYAEYKYIPSSVHGEMRTSLNFWHMGRIFSSRPSLNADFIECDNTEVERIFAVNQDAENLYVYLHNHIKATRPMVYFGTPTI
jgi:hypothetical protein